MKVIDLIIKLANDEEMPSQIEWNQEKWYYIEEMKDYFSYDRKVHLFNKVFPNDGLSEFLNDEVTIVEDKEIEFELGLLDRAPVSECRVLTTESLTEKAKWEYVRKLIYEYRTDMENLKIYINEITRAVNRLMKGKKL